MNLYQASRQWSTRPEDERFWTLEEAMRQCLQYKETSVELRAVPYRDIRVEADLDDMRVNSPVFARSGVPDPTLSHYAFGQLCARSTPSCPPGFLRKLKPTLAAQVLNSCLKSTGEQEKAAQVLVHNNGRSVLRAATSDTYSRLWNADVFSMMMPMQGDGWRVPPARPVKEGQAGSRLATADDVLNGRGHGLSINIGDTIAPAGIYASDHDMFVFLVNESFEYSLSRGVFIWNSEVGDKSFGMCTFYYNHVCGNHIVWGASGVKEVRIKHLGGIDTSFRRVSVEIKEQMMDGATEDKAKLVSSQNLVIGRTKEEVVTALMEVVTRRRIQPLNQKLLEGAYDTAERHEDWYGPPNTAWAIVNGITENSQGSGHADSRNVIDRAAGRLLSSLV